MAPTLCTPGKLYSGKQLAQMGYKNVDPNTLYECDDDSDASFWHKCEAEVAEGTFGPYCPCDTGTAYCGYDFQLMNIITELGVADNDVWRCATPSKKEETCANGCFQVSGGNETDICRPEPANLTCTIGVKYCGFQLLTAGVTLWSPHPHVLYVCTDGFMTVEGMQPTRKCRGGCTKGNCSTTTPTQPPGFSKSALTLSKSGMGQPSLWVWVRFDMENSGRTLTSFSQETETTNDTTSDHHGSNSSSRTPVRCVGSILMQSRIVRSVLVH